MLKHRAFDPMNFKKKNVFIYSLLAFILSTFYFLKRNLPDDLTNGKVHSN